MLGAELAVEDVVHTQGPVQVDCFLVGCFWAWTALVYTVRVAAGVKDWMGSARRCRRRGVGHLIHFCLEYDALGHIGI